MAASDGNYLAIYKINESIEISSERNLTQIT